MPKQTTNIPVVSVGNNSIILPGPGTSAIISPNTANLQGGNANLGYTAILSDSSIADLAVTRALQTSVLPTVLLDLLEIMKMHKVLLQQDLVLELQLKHC